MISTAVITDEVAKAMGSLRPMLGRKHDDKTPSPVKKAGEWTTTDIASAGAKVAQQQDRFIQTMILQSQLLRHIRVLPMNSPTRKIDRIAFTSRVMHAGTEATEVSSKSKPTTAAPELVAKLYKGEVEVSYSTLEDVIEGARIRGVDVQQAVLRTILDALAKAMGRDLEEFAIQGDTASADADLAVQDGFLKLASNEYDHGGLAVTKAMFKGLQKKIPTRFRQDKSQLRTVVGIDTDLEWRDELADRATALGDVMVSDAQGRDIVVRNSPNLVMGAYGIPHIITGLMPEDLGSSSTEGRLLCSHPDNLVVGVMRDMLIDWDKDVRKSTIVLVPQFRVAFQMEDADGAARGINFLVS